MNMKKWYIQFSKDAIDVDYETTIESETEPGFWEVQAIADEHECEFWCMELKKGE